MDRALLERYAPASALIDRQLRVHYLRGPTEDYLRPPSGEPSYNLIGMAREGLQSTVRAAVRKAIVDGQEVTADASVRRSAAWHAVRVVARPLHPRPGGDARLLVSFFEREVAADAAPPAEVGEARGRGRAAGGARTARQDLRLTIEHMEAANEELKASNEEIRSINEELQASNEELETSKEELQSLNEELNTVNAQLQAKVVELEARTDDLNNLLNSTDVATLFLDRSLVHPVVHADDEGAARAAARGTSAGRSRTSRSGSAAATCSRMRGACWSGCVPSDAEVVDDLGRWYIRHIGPYRTATDRIGGVVVTFVEITERKRCGGGAPGGQGVRGRDRRQRARAAAGADARTFGCARPTKPSSEPFQVDRRRCTIGLSTIWATGRGTSRSCAGSWRRCCPATSRSSISRSSTTSSGSGTAPCC